VPDGYLRGTAAIDTADGTFAYTWNGENRLIRVAGKNPSSAADKKLEFAYDYLGRRVEKAVYAWDPNAADWEDEPEVVRRLVYADWLLVLELDATDPNDVAVLRKHTWGLDLAGQNGSVNSIGAAGGIGGLLATYDVDDSKSYIYFYDATLDTRPALPALAGFASDAAARRAALQGRAYNVGQLVDRSDGSPDARYEYDAYGNTIASGGDYADNNPFRFSTKYYDAELDYAETTNDGLYYFGYRYYSPRLGRWLHRDPLGEAGGLNLNAYVANAPSIGVDALGLEPQVRWFVDIRIGTKGATVDAVLRVTVVDTPCCFCDAIRWIQIVEEHKLGWFGRSDTETPELDGAKGSAPWYVEDIAMADPVDTLSGCSVASEMRDSPGAHRFVSRFDFFMQAFESCAVCLCPLNEQHPGCPRWDGSSGLRGG
jgi:RHS repeat-associated protein